MSQAMYDSTADQITGRLCIFAGRGLVDFYTDTDNLAEAVARLKNQTGLNNLDTKTAFMDGNCGPIPSWF